MLHHLLVAFKEMSSIIIGGHMLLRPRKVTMSNVLPIVHFGHQLICHFYLPLQIPGPCVQPTFPEFSCHNLLISTIILWAYCIKIQFFQVPVSDNWILSSVLNSIRRVFCTASRPLLPKTLDNLTAMHSKLNLSSSKHVSFWAICPTIFFGLFQKLHLLPTSHCTFVSYQQFIRFDFMYDVYGILLRVCWYVQLPFLLIYFLLSPQSSFYHFACRLPNTLCCAYFPGPILSNVQF